MGRNFNDGRGRLGGRAKGTPNKTPIPQDDWTAEILQKYRTRVEEEIKKPYTPTVLNYLGFLTLAQSINRLCDEIKKDRENAGN